MKRSALFHLHSRERARFSDQDGWEIPAFFSSAEAEAAAVLNTAGVADLSYRSKFDCRAKPGSHGWRLGSDHYLAIGDPPMMPPSGAVDVTSVYANLLLAGPRSREVLGKLTSLNVSDKTLPNLSAGQAMVAHAPAMVLREDFPRVPAFHILVSREYGESVWDAILHAGHEFHMVPFGLKALKSLRA